VLISGADPVQAQDAGKDEVDIVGPEAAGRRVCDRSRMTAAVAE
jgi:hypothetical protein